MIVKMKKLTLLVYQKHIEIALQKLRSLGLLHIENLRAPASSEIAVLSQKLKSLDKALKVIAAIDREDKYLEDSKLFDYIKEIITLDRKKQEVSLRLKDLEEREAWFGEWGNVSQGSLEELRKGGVFLKLYVCSKKFLKSIPQDKAVFILGRKDSSLKVAAVSIGKEKHLNCQEVEIPAENQALVQKETSNILKDISLIDKKLVQMAAYKKSFKRQRKELLKQLEFYKVRFGMEAKEEISFLKGFCPSESVSNVKKEAEKSGWAIITEDPSDADEVPTLIRSPKWISIIKPVFTFMGTLPGYKEYDISCWFLLFFSLFFAMLIGDAGYGIIFILVTFFVQKKFPHLPKMPFYLMYALSTTTVVWGAVSGSWFGFEGIAHLPFFNSLVVERLNAFIDANQMFLIYLCFLIGAIQMTIAHGVVALRFINSLFALSQIGWISTIWGIFFLIKTLVIKDPFPWFASYLLISGIALVILFSNPQKNILKGIAVSFAYLPLKFISSFGDNLSYVRLFAVGYASVKIASSFNKIALSIGFHNILASLIAALILIFGHVFNIILALMAVLVHGVRLNMLEFSGHLGMEWNGKPYAPFKE